MVCMVRSAVALGGTGEFVYVGRITVATGSVVGGSIGGIVVGTLPGI